MVCNEYFYKSLLYEIKKPKQPTIIYNDFLEGFKIKELLFQCWPQYVPIMHIQHNCICSIPKNKKVNSLWSWANEFLLRNSRHFRFYWEDKQVAHGGKYFFSDFCCIFEWAVELASWWIMIVAFGRILIVRRKSTKLGGATDGLLCV